MGVFNFLGGNIAAPSRLAGSAVIRSTLQSVSLKRAQKNAFAPDAGRGMTRRDFSRPNRVFRRTESDWRMGRFGDPLAIRPAELRPERLGGESGESPGQRQQHKWRAEPRG